jgi:hypothetical protein
VGFPRTTEGDTASVGSPSAAVNVRQAEEEVLGTWYLVPGTWYLEIKRRSFSHSKGTEIISVPFAFSVLDSPVIGVRLISELGSESKD